MTQSDIAVKAIRAIDLIDCDNLLDIFNVLTAKMVAAGFAQVDIDLMDEVAGFVRGEDTTKAELPAFIQCAEEGARQRFAMRGEA